MRCKKIIFLIFLMLLGLKNIEAMSLKPTGSTKAARGEDVTIYINLNRTSSEATISGVDGIVSWDADVLTLSSQTKLLSASYTTFATVTNGKKFSYGNLNYDELISDTSKNIVKLVFKVNNNAAFGNTNITLTKPVATDKNGDSVSVTGGTLSLNILSSVNTLSSLSLNGEEIAGFAGDKTSYNATFPATTTSVLIEATATDANATISGSVGNKTLAYGMNVFKVNVTGASGVKKIYTLNIKREDNRSKVNTLKTLSLSEGIINFSSSVNNYNLTVLNEVEKVTITSTLTDTTSSYVTNYGNREVSLKEGLNKILIKVSAENKTINTYTLNITRAGIKEILSDNTNITDLKISNYDLTFDNNTLDYSLKINEEEKLDINVTLESEKANYIITGNENLKNDSIITISITAEDGTNKEYRIKILKDEKQDDDKKEQPIEESSSEKKENGLYVTILEILVIVQFLLIGILAFLLKKKKRKKKIVSE